VKLNDTLKLVLAVMISELAGVLGSFFTIPSSSWYIALAKPALNPPSSIFGPVWVVLYLLMGISLWLVWKSSSSKKKSGLWLFAVQLLLNTIWSPIFFGAHAIGSALGVIVLLWAAILLTILMFKKASKIAGWLLVPYILWVSFAVYLNFSIWMLN
jgi:tryptophan-rich sensory protein